MMAISMSAAIGRDLEARIAAVLVQEKGLSLPPGSSPRTVTLEFAPGHTLRVFETTHANSGVLRRG